MKILILGYGPAAIKALEAVEHYADASSIQRPDVTVISSQDGDAYAPMFLIKYITGQLTERQLMLVPDRKEYNFPLRKILGKRVVRVMEKKKTIVLEDGQEVGFDKLLIATGASPIIPPIKGLTKKGVFYITRLDGAKKISQVLEQTNNVVIIGAGAMGMEAAIALHNLGKKVKVVELVGQILPQTQGLDLAKYAQKKLESQGLEFCLGEAVAEIIGDERAEGVLTQGGKEIKGDLIIITAGVKPNMEFLKTRAIKTDRGIIVNDGMETNISGIYAAGDVVESKNRYGGYELVFNWYSAVSQGWVAGCNMMGGQESYRFCPMLSALKEVDFPIISIGKKRESHGRLLAYKDEKKGIFEEFYISDNHIDSYQAIGIKDKAGLIYSLIKNRKRVDKIEESLLLNSFNAAHLTA